jgi:hypothetical protein
MKTRNGFVSNSSSSSFLVALKKIAPCSHCGRSDPDFFDVVTRMGNDGWVEETKLEARGVKECIDKYFEYSKEDQGPLRNKLMAMEADGYEVGIVDIAYHDQITDDIFQNLKNSGALTVLETIY